MLLTRKGWSTIQSVQLLPLNNGALPSYGGWILDGYGGIHPFGLAPVFIITPYWKSWNIIHSLVIYRTPIGGYYTIVLFCLKFIKIYIKQKYSKTNIIQALQNKDNSIQ